MNIKSLIKNILYFILCIQDIFMFKNFFKALVEDLDKDTLWNIMAAIMDTYNLEITSD